MRGRNRLVPRLLGITRESVLRVDENTKEVLKAWPLTTVRRWAASPNSFTLVRGCGRERGRAIYMYIFCIYINFKRYWLFNKIQNHMKSTILCTACCTQ